MSKGGASSGFELAANSPDTLGVRGVLSFATAAQALHALHARLSAAATTKTLDLSGVTHADSAGLACLLVVLGEASMGGRELHLTHIPDGMRVLARVCGVEPLLG